MTRPAATAAAPLEAPSVDPSAEPAAGPDAEPAPAPVDPPAALLRALLDAGGRAPDADALESAGRELDATPPGGDPLERVRALLRRARVVDATPMLLPWRRFDRRRLPALVTRDGAWHLAESGEGRALRLSTPGEPGRTVDEAELAGATVLWLRLAAAPAPDADASARGNPAVALLRRELLRERGWVARVVVATATVNLLAVATSLFAMQVYDRVVPTLAYATFTTLVAGMTIVIVLDWTLRTLRARIVDSVASAVDERLSQHVFEHLMHLRLDARPTSLGTLAGQVGGLDTVRQFFSSAVVFALVDIPFALMFVAFIGVIGGTVAWVYVAMMLAALAVGLLGQARARHLAELQQQRGAERQGLLVDAICGAESIRAANAGWHFSSEWAAITSTISGHAIRQKAITTFSTVTITALSTSAYVGAVVVGVWRIEAGLMTMGAMIACSILGGRVIGPVSQGAQYLVQWQGVSQALEQVGRFLSLERERREGQTLLVPDRAPRSVALDAVRFGYEGSPVHQVDVPELRLSAGGAGAAGRPRRLRQVVAPEDPRGALQAGRGAGAARGRGPVGDRPAGDRRARRLPAPDGAPVPRHAQEQPRAVRRRRRLPNAGGGAGPRHRGHRRGQPARAGPPRQRGRRGALGRPAPARRARPPDRGRADGVAAGTSRPRRWMRRPRRRCGGPSRRASGPTTSSWWPPTARARRCTSPRA